MEETLKHRLVGTLVLLILLGLAMSHLLSRSRQSFYGEEQFSGLTQTSVLPELKEEKKGVLTSRLPQKSPHQVIKTVESTSKKLWRVQIASLSKEQTALNMVKQLKSKGYPANIQTAQNSKGKQVTRVLVGPYQNYAKASSVIGKLHKEIRFKGFVSHIKK